MELIDTRSLAGPAAWYGPTYTGFAGAAVKLRWIDRPYRWHRNESREFFFVVSGSVEMNTRKSREFVSTLMEAGQGVLIEAGEEHVAHPREPSRVLIVEAG